MRETKRVNGDNPVEASTQSRTAGTAAGGTRRKLFHREVMREAVASLSFTAIIFNW